jgi:hypothetical protein
MRLPLRIGHLCLLGLTFAIPWITINLLFRMPNRMWWIFAGEFAAFGATLLALRALQRRARFERRAGESPGAAEQTSN